MTAQTTLAPTPELTPLAEFLAGVLKKIQPLPPLDLDLTQAYGNVLASDVRAPTALPPFDRAAIDGYAASEHKCKVPVRAACKCVRIRSRIISSLPDPDVGDTIA